MRKDPMDFDGSQAITYRIHGYDILADIIDEPDFSAVGEEVLAWFSGQGPAWLPLADVTPIGPVARELLRGVR